MRKTTILSAALLALLPASAGAGRITLDLKANGYEFTGGSIEMRGFSSLLSPGRPHLPERVCRLALPPEADLRSLSIKVLESEEEEIPGSFSIGPCPPAASGDGAARRVEWGRGKRIVNGRDENVYGKDAFYPSKTVEFLRAGRLRNWKIAEIAFRPVRYNPVDKSLIITRSASVALDYRAARTSLRSDGFPSAARMRAAKIVENFEEAEGWYEEEAGERAAAAGGGPAPASIYDYVIVTTNAVESGSSSLSGFVAHKENAGFSVLVITEDEFGGGTGAAAAANIRNWLQAYYASYGIEYVLLIGNPNPTSGEIPMKMCYPGYNEAPCDYFYADLSGTWDLNGNGSYGEGADIGAGGVDRYPEVLVGRIPNYGDLTELDSILAKTMAYEGATSPESWREKVLFPLVPFDGTCLSYQLGEQLRTNYALPLDFSTYRIYSSSGYYIPPNPPPDDAPCSASKVAAEWPNGYGVVCWQTHGSATSASSIFSTSYVSYLDDSMPSFTWQGSCQNAYPENTGNLAYELLANGCVAATAATRNSWYWLYQTDYTDGRDSIGGLGYLYTSRLLQNMPAGDAIYDAKYSVTSFSLWVNHCVFNLYGDPSVSLRRIPRNCDVDIDGDVDGDDVGYLAAQWGGDFVPCDYDGDEEIGACDLGSMMSGWTGP